MYYKQLSVIKNVEHVLIGTLVFLFAGVCCWLLSPNFVDDMLINYQYPPLSKTICNDHQSPIISAVISAAIALSSIHDLHPTLLIPARDRRGHVHQVIAARLGAGVSIVHTIYPLKGGAMPRSAVFKANNTFNTAKYIWMFN